MPRKRRIRLLVPRGTIGPEEGLIQPRSAAWVLRERARQLRRGGNRTATERASDTAHRNLGIPVYDTQTAQAHLAELLHKGKQQKP